MAHFIICYDIQDIKRLNRVRYYLQHHAMPLQHSIFLLTGTEQDFLRCMEKLSAEIHPKQDDLRGYRIPHSIPICRFGKGIFPEGIVWSEWPSVIGGEE
ncbi:CRISPR-associated endonuclease Cas2 [Aquaspirillum soli]